jgi:two-component system sensor histidine kinase AlgZ
MNNLIEAAPQSPAPQFWFLLWAALPVTFCLAILSLPDLGKTIPTAYRAFFLCAYLIWIVPLAKLQHALWQRKKAWWAIALILLGATYLMSVINNILGQRFAIELGLIEHHRWERIFNGLDSCWLPLIAFCALQAVLTFHSALGREQVRVAEALALARDAELRALRYQLHPHFLFNTLNAISSLVVSERNREANRMITLLAQFLRTTLEQGERHEHALADELALTESYLDIEKTRLGDRLAIGLHIGPDVLAVQVPTLILQPLVENAVRHGIAPRTEPGRIDLHIARVGARLQICLRNDGPPAQAKLEPDRQSYRIGMRNVAERLARLYGDEHLFSFEEKGQSGFEVTLAFPVKP